MSIDPVSELEQTLNELAVALFSAGTVGATLQRTVDLAVDSLDGCDSAGIVLIDGEPTTMAASDSLAVDIGRLQFEVGEGPCLDCATNGGSVYAADLAVDPLWPVFGPAATALGVRSILAFRLSARHQSALNLYGRLPAAFGAHDRATGSIFATLAGLALDSAENRDELERTALNLQEALRTRELIGQAQGILMERDRITATQAFDVLRRASQNLNTKLRAVAETVVETGERPGGQR